MSNINDFFNKGRQYEHSPMMHVQDQKPTGTDGGDSVVGDNPRDLNTVLTNEIVGASLSSNAVTLPAGEYYIDCFSTSYITHKTSLKIISSTGDILLSSTTGYLSDSSNSNISGMISLTSSDTITIVLYANGSITTTGLGYASSDPNIPHETYTDLKIWKLDAIKTSPILYDNRLYPLPGNTYVIGNIYGLDYRKTGDHTISVDAGICMDSLNTTILTGSALQTVTIGSTINEIYNLFLCDDGTVQTDTNVDGATLLAGSVSQLRWIGFVRNNASGVICDFHTNGNRYIFDDYTEQVIVAASVPTSFTLVDFTPFIPIQKCEGIGVSGYGTSSAEMFWSYDGINTLYKSVVNVWSDTWVSLPEDLDPVESIYVKAGEAAMTALLHSVALKR